ncbi:MAG: isochorismatase family protein [Planctomycetes bacterium]|nr:isochorismatase family protein [Planctomycetota bacterium]
MKNLTRLDPTQAQLLIVDIQERLLPYISDHALVTAQALRMIRVARTIPIPIVLSEQYPKGLGPTDSALLEAAGAPIRVEKNTFSVCADTQAKARIVELARPQVLLVGIEAHVCVQQTALDLLETQMQPFLLADAVGSRRPRDCETALHRMRQAGVIVTTVE